jgi:hypothetical protein
MFLDLGYNKYIKLTFITSTNSSIAKLTQNKIKMKFETLNRSELN